jgi:uncharacterized membrane protein YidH (DUF202 family)
MIKYLIFIVLLKFLLIVSPIFCGEVVLPDGVGLYLNACQNRGNNYVMLRSVFMDLELQRQQTKKTPEEIEAQARKMVEDIRQQLGDNHPSIKVYTDISGTIESLNRHYAQASTSSRFRVLYRADDAIRHCLSITVDEKNPKDQSWETRSVALEATRNFKEIISAFWFSQQREVIVGSMPSVSDIFLNMGRIRGDGISLVEAFFLQGGNIKKYEFSQEKINKFKAEIEKQRASGKIVPLITVSMIGYDEPLSKAFVVESSKAGVVMERFWIDASRGYVCPLVQYFTEKGELTYEYKASKFFLEKTSGLWFPAHYSEFESGQKNVASERRTYRLDPTSLKVNVPISDGEFFFDVPEETIVKDSRSKKTEPIRYKAVQKGSLSLTKGGLDLEKMNWLFRITDIDLNVKKKISVGANILRILLIICGMTLILLAFFRLFKKKKSLTLVATILVIILTISFVLLTGCSYTNSDSVVLVPENLDFGKLRPTDSPVNVEITLKNNQSTPCNILQVLPDCGCTILDIPSQPIPPKTEKKIPIKVNLYGHIGNFESRVCIKTSARIEPFCG